MTVINSVSPDPGLHATVNGESFRYPENFYGAMSRSATKKTLVLCPIGLGNFLMATPGLSRLSHAVGPENLQLIALKDSIRQLAEPTGLFGTIHTWDPDKESKAEGIKLLAKLRAQKFDFSLSLFPSGNWRFAAFAAAVGARARVGFEYPQEKLPTTVQTLSAPLNFSAHDTDQNCDMIEALIGTPSTAPRELIFPYAPHHPDAERLRAEPYFVCHPGSSAERGMKEKRLPPDAFGRIITQIYKQFGMKCVLIGGPEEKDLRDEVTAHAPDAILPYGSRSLIELSGLIDPAQFYLGNDSGLMHISVALGKRCVAFFGPTDERRTGPYADGLRFGHTPHLILRREELECAPCWTIRTIGKNPPCIYGDTRCLKQMNVDAIWPKLSDFIQSLA